MKTKECVDLTAQLARLGLGVDQIRRVFRAANAMQRSSEAECSCPLDEERDRLQRRADAAVGRIGALPAGITLETQGDPRGCPISFVHRTERYESRVSIPGDGYPSRVFDHWGSWPFHQYAEKANKEYRKRHPWPDEEPAGKDGAL